MLLVSILHQTRHIDRRQHQLLLVRWRASISTLGVTESGKDTLQEMTIPLLRQPFETLSHSKGFQPFFFLGFFFFTPPAAGAPPADGVTPVGTEGIGLARAWSTAKGM